MYADEWAAQRRAWLRTGIATCHSRWEGGLAGIILVARLSLLMRRTCSTIRGLSARAGLHIACFIAANSCSVYDDELIARERQAATALGAGRDSGPADDERSDAEPASEGTPGATQRSASNASDGGGRQAPASPIPVDRTACGDGRVSGPEKCDTAIHERTPGACPVDCPALKDCAPRELNGSGCQAECVLLELVCAGGDGCCPGKCNASNDADCSGSCGDGIIDANTGETCEPETNMPCAQTEAECDDGDPCSIDALQGSAKNCNAVCTNTLRAESLNADGCCSDQANANVDSDCQPSCGNGVREPGEECDGETGCDVSCRPMMTAEQRTCLERLGDDDCAKCSCTNCTERFLACHAGMDPRANELCGAVLRCSRANECFGDACYCGDSCVDARGPDGACRSEIEAAANASDPLLVLLARTDPASTLGRAYYADECRVQQCGDVCR